jgi:hypothetical protein
MYKGRRCKFLCSGVVTSGLKAKPYEKVAVRTDSSGERIKDTFNSYHYISAFKKETMLLYNYKRQNYNGTDSSYHQNFQ